MHKILSRPISLRTWIIYLSLFYPQSLLSPLKIHLGLSEWLAGSAEQQLPLTFSQTATNRNLKHLCSTRPPPCSPRPCIMYLSSNRLLSKTDDCVEHSFSYRYKYIATATRDIFVKSPRILTWCSAWRCWWPSRSAGRIAPFAGD